nr:diacylglycerol kinase family protein [uncultured Devosia sp.]
MHFIAVLNRGGGTLRTMDLDEFCRSATAIFERHGDTLDCRIVDGKQVEKELEKAAREAGVGAIIAGGGDGTISTAAAIAFRTETPLAILPAGTMNLFARAMKVPLVLEEALEAIADGEVGAVDIATANGRPFVHQFSVGIHARLVRIRENMTYRSRVGKMVASLRAIGAAAMNPPQFEAELHTSKGIERRMVSGIAISNNPLGDGLIHADGLGRHVLGVYIAAPLGTFGLLRLALDVALGRWRESPLVSEKEIDEVTLHFPKRKRGAKAVVDGELINLDPAVRLEVHADGLKMVLPKSE